MQHPSHNPPVVWSRLCNQSSLPSIGTVSPRTQPWPRSQTVWGRISHPPASYSQRCIFSGGTGFLLLWSQLGSTIGTCRAQHWQILPPAPWCERRGLRGGCHLAHSWCGSGILLPLIQQQHWTEFFLGIHGGNLPLPSRSKLSTTLQP